MVAHSRRDLANGFVASSGQCAAACRPETVPCASADASTGDDVKTAGQAASGIDHTVLLCAHDSGASAHVAARRLLRDLMERGGVVIPRVELELFLAKAVDARTAPAERTLRAVRELLADVRCEVVDVAVDDPLLTHALDAAADLSMNPWPTCFTLASLRKAGAGRLYSSSPAYDAKVLDIEVINPFEVRESPAATACIPYSRHVVDDQDVAAVSGVLRSNWLTTGPKVPEFERAVADFCGARQAVAYSSGTAALHGVMHALGIGAGDTVVVPTMSFAASANCVLYCGGQVRFADVGAADLLLDPASARARIDAGTRAVVAVDYAGQPCDYDALKALCREKGLPLVADACHALGAARDGIAVGSLADMTVFSFHPVKHITTGEGGLVVTDSDAYAERLRLFRNHGIDSDHRQRERAKSWRYDMVMLGYNYRITDMQCALGISQLAKLGGWLRRREELAALYREALVSLPGVMPLAVSPRVRHAYHLFVVRIIPEMAGITRDELFPRLRDAGIGVNVHYKPIHLHTYYRRCCGTGPGLCPEAERAFDQILSLPLYPGMSRADLERVVEALLRHCGHG